MEQLAKRLAEHPQHLAVEVDLLVDVDCVVGDIIIKVAFKDEVEVDVEPICHCLAS